MTSVSPLLGMTRSASRLMETIVYATSFTMSSSRLVGEGAGTTADRSCSLNASSSNAFRSLGAKSSIGIQEPQHIPVGDHMSLRRQFENGAGSPVQHTPGAFEAARPKD